MQYLKKEIENQIYEIAVRDFLQHGYTGTTMRSIAKEVGITATNIYRYFENKEDLFERIVSPVYQMVTELFQMNADSTLSIVEVGETLLNRLPYLVNNYRKELLVLIDGSKGTKFENAKEEIIQVLTNDVSRHIQQYNQHMQATVFYPNLARPFAVSFLEGILEIIRRSKDSQEIMALTAQFIQLYFFWSVQSSEISHSEEKKPATF